MIQRYNYGTDPSQYAQLYLPRVRRFDGVAVIIHGGYWRSQYTAELGVPLAKDLAAHGIAAWNLEYRRAGGGGGWPQTFEDVAAGIDKLADAAAEHGLPLSHVVALGHSAGGHLAVWAAGRDQMPGAGLDGAVPGGRPVRVPLTAVVSQSGVLDLDLARRLDLSRGAVVNLLGSTPEAAPERYRLADPLRQLPLAVPVYAVQAEEDTAVPAGLSQSYVAASEAAVRAAGTAAVPATLIWVPGDHSDLIDVTSAAYARCRELVQQSMGALQPPAQSCRPA